MSFFYDLILIVKQYLDCTNKSKKNKNERWFIIVKTIDGDIYKQS